MPGHEPILICVYREHANFKRYIYRTGITKYKLIKDFNEKNYNLNMVRSALSFCC